MTEPHTCTPDEQDCCRRCTICHRGHLPDEEPHVAMSSPLRFRHTPDGGVEAYRLVEASDGDDDWMQPVTEFTLTEAETNALVVAHLTGPTGPPGPTGPMGVRGPAASDGPSY